MMGQFTLVPVAALLINTLSCCSAENVYCVTLTASSCSSCPHSNHCATLSEYAQQAELYFTSNTTMVFLPGDHTLDKNITVAEVTGLTMYAESSSANRPTIVCSVSVGLSFTRMVNFKMHSLAFTSCSRKYTIALPGYSSTTIYVALFLQSTQYAELVNCSFHDNLGTALVVNNTNVTLAGDSEFTRNRACGNILAGGAIIALGSYLTFTGNTTFLDNSATLTESCMQVYCKSTTFTAFGGGAIYTINNTVLIFTGTSNFINNLAGAGYGFGGAISANSKTVLSFNGTNNFINNTGDYRGGAISISDNTVLSFSGTSNFTSNSAYYDGGAICAESNTSLTFNGTTYFTSNGHYEGKTMTQNKFTNHGGGLFMELKTTLSILPNTTVYWENNHATRGGAIYVADTSPLSYCTPLTPYIPQEECFFQLPGQNLSSINVQLIFINNSADDAGSVLYGGAIDHCKLSHGPDLYSSGKVFDMLVHNNDTDYNTTSNISSDPLQICLCEDNLPKCSMTQYELRHVKYPGETFQFSVVAVGQRNGPVPSTVISTLNSIQNPDGTNLLGYQYLQQANNTCTKLNYTLLSLSSFVDIWLHAEGSSCSKFGDLGTLCISVFINQICPPGFNISGSQKSCVCEPRLAHYTNTCIITNGLGRITRDSGRQFWVGYDSQSSELILHPLCPFDYCASQTVAFPLNNTDLQCAHNRTGLLCGACKKGYSLVLGTSHCHHCTNSHLFLLIPFAVMGIALVFFLLVCKLTVATGTLSGLVFYANIVAANRTFFLPVESTNVFSVFIAWLNLNFGIETCFYNGMDAYSKTWLQFVFPGYIWMLVGLMIIISHYSRRFAKLLGNNPVSVLATLILLSYTTIQHTLITMPTTYLEYPTYNRMVWLYDANLDYLGVKHIPLFIVAMLVFLFLFLPYTLLIVFGQWLQAISHLRLFSWVNRLKPFIDAYHAPYRAKHRYWPGLLLVIRFVLLLVFAFNPQQDPSVNLLAIIIGTGVLLVWAWVSGGVYRNWCLDALEGSFALNLIILAAATYHVKLSGGNQLAVGYTSISIAFATFIGILVFQIANVTGITQYLKRKCPSRNQAETDVEPQDDGFLPDRMVNPEEYKPTFHTSQRNTITETTEGANEAQRWLIPPYTYGSIN